MPISTIEILRLTSDICEEQNIKVAVQESMKGGILTGTATIIGGLTLGPIGLATGGALGGLASYFMCRDKFQSVASIIMSMEPTKQEILANRIRTFLQTHAIREVSSLPKLLSSPYLKMILIELALGVLFAIVGFVFEKIKIKREEKKNQI